MARARICRTADEAFEAGWNEPCDHGRANPADCPTCGLTDVEITRLTVLLSGLAPSAAAAPAAA
ncbi:hypothetical protein LXH13_06475 [Streptomyces spinosirectus]|jgi:hypothetical protein|uniref:hypothetical protein n=1 Tax=Streptomyces TaxID=1883 RepID=UPI000FFF5C5B|nr:MULTISPECIES: hypothetical protein [Streptomyces]MBY8341949.1 hypothetical protein [Streptomyces plumbidurans]UIR16702.1 hypothetical protein LXH13_06475 [Streptomyces spinosirectus]